MDSAANHCSFIKPICAGHSEINIRFYSYLQDYKAVV